ncbi:hypothetical protein BC833DRAFT_618652 [Globomyces pollinis-pini]|nr:hypothetical protein BC833DRAFT_618652 [Globomyces pollinis-pini]
MDYNEDEEFPESYEYVLDSYGDDTYSEEYVIEDSDSDHSPMDYSNEISTSFISKAAQTHSAFKATQKQLGLDDLEELTMQTDSIALDTEEHFQRPATTNISSDNEYYYNPPDMSPMNVDTKPTPLEMHPINESFPTDNDLSFSHIMQQIQSPIRTAPQSERMEQKPYDAGSKISDAFMLARKNTNEQSIYENLDQKNNHSNLSIDTRFTGPVPTAQTVKTFRIPTSKSDSYSNVMSSSNVSGSPNPMLPKSPLSRSSPVPKSPAVEYKPEDMMPILPEMHYQPANANYSKIVNEAAKRQERIQSMFRKMETPKAEATPVHVAVMYPTITSEETPFGIPPPPETGPSTEELRKLGINVPKRGKSMQSHSSHTSPNQQSRFNDDISSVQSRMSGSIRRSVSQSSRMQSEEEVLRLERLASLGIFEVNPKAKTNSISDVSRMPLESFATPMHQRPERLSSIGKITGPQLISTSSRMQTVPISEILKDLKAAGKLKDSDLEKSPNQFQTLKSKFFK